MCGWSMRRRPVPDIKTTFIWIMMVHYWLIQLKVLENGTASGMTWSRGFKWFQSTAFFTSFGSVFLCGDFIDRQVLFSLSSKCPTQGRIYAIPGQRQLLLPDALSTHQTTARLEIHASDLTDHNVCVLRDQTCSPCLASYPGCLRSFQVCYIDWGLVKTDFKGKQKQ